MKQNNRRVSKRNNKKNEPVMIEDGEEYFTIEKILDRMVGNDGKIYYLIKWLGYSDDENSWIPIENFSSHTEINDDEIAKFLEREKETNNTPNNLYVLALACNLT